MEDHYPSPSPTTGRRNKHRQSIGEMSRLNGVNDLLNSYIGIRWTSEQCYVGMSEVKTQASRYSIETVLRRLVDYPKELPDLIKFQDEDGETASTMAARCRSTS